MNKCMLCLLMVLAVLKVSPAFGGEDLNLYSLARKEVKIGNMDFAFMRYRSILRGYPNSRWREQALFAYGEYYLVNKNYPEAMDAFSKFVREFPDSKAKLFALACLLKVSQIQKNEDLTVQYENDIINLKQVGLVFRDFKEYKYLSPLNRSYLAIFQIETIDFLVQGDLFVKISY